MAVINEMASPERVKAFRGVLDFYCYRGLNCVRRWPRKPVMPRSLPSQQSAAEFADYVRSLGLTDARLRDEMIAVVHGTDWTWRDMVTAAAYGNLHSWGDAPLPPPPVEELDMIAFALAAQTSDTQGVKNINSLTYVTHRTLRMRVDFSAVPYTHFRIYGHMGPSEIAQTVTLQLAAWASPGTPLSAAGNDLAFTGSPTHQDSGWIALAAPPVTDQDLVLAMKGTNATVDLFNHTIYVLFKQIP